MNEDFRLGEWLIQPTLGRISVDGQFVAVRAKVMDLLVYLASREGAVASKGEILDAVWKTDAITEAALTRTVTELRQAFGDDAANPRVLETIPKRGYRLLVPSSPPDSAKVPADHDGPDPSSVRSHLPHATVAAAVIAALICGVVAWAATRARDDARDAREQPWREVTTKSHEARQLFLAGLDAVAGRSKDWNAAGPLFARAAEIDPQFASARIWHAWATFNCVRIEEAISVADVASAGAAQLPILERQWILASAASMKGDSARAVEHLAPIAAMQPTHFWALNNLSHEYTLLGEDEPAAEFAVRAALLRPDWPGVQENAAHRLMAVGRRDEARRFALQSVRLVDATGEFNSATYMRLLPAFEAWLDRRPEDVLRIADPLSEQLSGRAPGSPWGSYADNVAAAYIWIGRITRASELSFYTPWPKRHRFWIHLHQGTLDDWRASVAADWPGFGDGPQSVVAGPLDIARQVVDKSLKAHATRVDRGHHLALRAILNARLGNSSAAVRELKEAIPLLRHSGDTYMFLATEMVVPHFGDDLEAAYHALRTVADEKHHLSETLNADLWQRTRVLEARTARKLGLTAEADAIEQELRELSRLADPCTRNCQRLHLHRN